MVKLKHLILTIVGLSAFTKRRPMKVFTTGMTLVFLSPFLLQAQIAETVTTRNFEPVSGNQLLIRFTVPNTGEDLSYNLHSAYMYSANGSKITIGALTGEQLNLSSGAAYELLWDVLRDTDELEQPESVEINLEYTPASRIKASERTAEQSQEYKTQRKQQVIFDQEPEEHMEHHERPLHHFPQKNRPALRLGLLGHAGYVKAQLNNAHQDINYDFGYGYGLGAFLEIHMGGSTYLQLEGAYAIRNFEFNNLGFFKAPNGCEYLYNIEQAKLSFTDYRVAGRIKLGILQLGAYYSFLQEADRSGEMNVQITCQDGFYTQINEENFEYS